MKDTIRFIATAAALLTAALSCRREELPADGITPEVSAHTVNFIAGAPDTRTSYSIEDGKVKYAWVSGDRSKFTVYENGVAASETTGTLSDDGVMTLKATFNGDAPATTPTYQAVFNSGVEFRQAETVKSPYYDQDSDVLVSNTLTPDSSRPESFTFKFRREVAMVKMTLKELDKGDKLAGVTISADKPLSGDYVIGKGFTASADSTELFIDASTSISAGVTTVYFSTRPVENATLTITVKTTSEASSGAIDGTWSKTLSKTISFTAGDLKAFTVNLTGCEIPFFETFNTCDGSGGNDGQWSGKIALGTLSSDYSGWTNTKGTKACHCAKFGTQSEQGCATTPKISLTASATLKFRAGAWDSDKTTLNISSTGGTLSKSSVTLDSCEFNDYEISLTSVTDSVQITFTGADAKNSRFFLDDVRLYNSSTAITYSSNDGGTVSGPATAYAGSTVSVTVTPDDGYILTGLTAGGEDILESRSFTMPEARDVAVVATFSEVVWGRITCLDSLLRNGTVIIGYEATAKSGVIVPMQNSGTATTSGAGYMYSGTSDGESGNGTIDMGSVKATAKYEVKVTASATVSEAVNIMIGENYLGNTDTKNNCKLFTAEATTTAFTPTIGDNDVVTLTIKANSNYTTLQYNATYGSNRFAVYGGTQRNIVLYRKYYKSGDKYIPII